MLSQFGNQLSQPVPACTNLVELLRYRASQQGDQLAYIFLGDGENETARLTYGQLDSQARAIAARLLNRYGSLTGQPVLVCHAPGLDYLAAFFGILYAGAVAVPAYAPDSNRLSRSLPRLQAILKDAGAKIALTGREQMAELARWQLPESDFLQLDWIETPVASGPESVEWPGLALDGAALAFLMYTSGSTGDPKGVMVNQANVLHNLANFAGFEARPLTGFVSWLPFFHDLGLLMGILHPLYQGVLSVLMPSASFIQRPLRWLAAISRYKVSATGGPNFAYDLCARKIKPEERAALDLSGWNLALNGAEPVRSATLERFNQTFAESGFRPETFYPSYGLAEGTATVAGGPGFTKSQTLWLERSALTENRVTPSESEAMPVFVGLGQVLPGQLVIAVNPRIAQECEAGQIGEIWVQGGSVAQGYWQRAELTGEIFRASVPTRPGYFLRTGDLGFIHNGEVYLTGRLKDLIIIRGINHYPDDLEQTVAAVSPLLRPGGGAAFAIEEDGEERLVVVHELNSAPGSNLSDLILSIRQAISENHELDLTALVLIEPGDIPKTSSGKIQRRFCRDRFLGYETPFKIIEEWHAPVVRLNTEPVLTAPAAAPARSKVAGAIETWLVDYLATRTGQPPAGIETAQPLTRYGLGSLQIINLVRDLEEWLGCILNPTVAWEYPTITALAQYLAGQEQVLPSGRFDQPEPNVREPIAIVGMGCRFPGAPDLAAYWQLLITGQDAVTEVPPDRWNIEEYFDPNPAAPGKTITRWGGFLTRLDEFDANFFGISPREASHLDPRQRQLLEAAWESLEDANIPLESLSGSRTGVFMAALSNDYDQLLFKELGRVDAYSGAGTANSIIANRLSYVFDLHGPSMTIDTACSGSLVALHLACQSLRQGESEMALVGGVNINLMPNGNIFFSKAGVISPDGHCKTFDARANGIVRSEGVGVIVLKPLSRASADGDNIYAVINGSAVNSDGRTNGLMAPSKQAQEAVLRQAYSQAGVAPEQVQYIEAHGTGTALGDPIEVQALASVFAPNRPGWRPLAIGSLKTNLGHTEAAAGIAGVIKVALALKQRQLPPSLHYEKPNPLIPFDQFPVRVQTVAGDWPDPDAPLYAGVSGFGFGGTNAHVVLGEAPVTGPAPVVFPAVEYLLPLSARTPQALKDLAGRYVKMFDCADAPDLREVAYSASLGRSHHNYRLSVVAADANQAASVLRAYLSGEARPGLAVSAKPVHRQPKIAFVFSGQGSHWYEMGLQLREQEPVFKAALDLCDQLLWKYVDWSLLEELAAGEAKSRLDQTDIAQPAIFALQVSLAALWQSWGVLPDVIVGQSLGEVAAAHVAGILSLEEALQVVVQRSRLMKQVAGQGKTALVGLPVDRLQLALTGWDDLLSVAGSNSPASSVLSGDPAALDRVLLSLQRQGIFCRELRGVDVAFHSPHMDALKPELVASLAHITPRPASVPVYSTVTTELQEGNFFDANYWGRNLREPFMFAPVVGKLISEQNVDVILEIAPHPVLSPSILESLNQGRPVPVIGSLKRNAPQRAHLLAGLGTLYTLGGPVNWKRQHPEPARPVSLPHYPWQRERYWFDQLDSELVRPASSYRRDKPGTHPLLGEKIELAVPNGGCLWETFVSLQTLAYMQEHVVQGAAMLPGSAYVEMALAAGGEAFGAAAGCLVEKLTFKQAFFIPDSGARQVQLILTPAGTDQSRFEIYSRLQTEQTNAGWTLHASGQLSYNPALTTDAPPIVESPASVQVRCGQALSSAAHYEAMENWGYHYGPAFQAIGQLWRQDGEAIGQLYLPPMLEFEASTYQLHPVFLDNCFQLVEAALPAEPVQPGGTSQATPIPVGVDRVRFYRKPGLRLWCHVIIRSDLHDSANRQIDLYLMNEAGELCAEINGLRFQKIGLKQPAPVNLKDWQYQVEWQEAEAPAQSPFAKVVPATWLVLGDTTGVGAALVEKMECAGHTPVLVTTGLAYHFDPLRRRASLDPAKTEHYRQLIADLKTADYPAWQGLAHLWSFEPASDITVSDTGLTSLIHFIQAVLRQSAGAAVSLPRFWLITKGAQAVRGLVTEPFQASMWGMGRVMALEHPQLWGGLVDLDPAASAEEVAGALMNDLIAPKSEDQLAFYAGKRYVARLVRHQTAGISPALPVRSDGAYLITGGLGGLGLAVGHWLVSQGASRLILLGRTSLPPRSEWKQLEASNPVAARVAAIRDLESQGASVHYACVDVANQAELMVWLAGYEAEGWPPIRGVIHSAGVLRDQLLMQLEVASLETVQQPKVAGAWALHNCLASASLDFFVLFSSAASVVGSFGQANYASANAFMDALAFYRCGQGLPALSINWGPWDEVGMAAEANLAEEHRRRGMTPIPPAQGLAILGELLSQDVVQVAVLAANWAAVKQALPPGVDPRLLSDLLTETVQTESKEVAPGDRFVDRLLQISEAAERETALTEHIKGLVAGVLKMDQARLDLYQSLNSLGLDSIMAVELKNRLETSLGLTLSLVELLQDLTVARAVARFLPQLQILDNELTEILTEVENYSVAELEALLA